METYSDRPVCIAPERYLDGVLGTPLGPGAKPCREEPFVVPPGGGLLLYTDGLVEERGESIDAGDDDVALLAARRA